MASSSSSLLKFIFLHILHLFYFEFSKQVVALGVPIPSSSLALSPSPSGQEQEQEAIYLMDFKSSISLDPSHLLSSWNHSSSPCTPWLGIDCDSSGRVASLSIPPWSGIRGSLSPSLANLTRLRTLSLPHNLFSGNIPIGFSQLLLLQTLELQGNHLSGPVPVHLPPSLALLNLSYNNLSGPLTPSFGSLLTVDVSNNQLSGSINMGSCESLVRLKLSNNNFIGNIPDDIAKCSKLRTLLLDGNSFQGRIPPQLGLLTELTLLDVSRNSLIDRIPEELAHCNKLSVLVFTNEIKGGEFNAFKGNIPYKVLSLPNLQVVWAPRANLGGRLPAASWTNSSCSLRVINLGQNYFNGVLPKSLSLCTNLTFLDLSSNYLQGYLPSQLQVPCMLYFNVSRNSLSGPIPQFHNFESSFGGNTMISYGKYSNSLVQEDDIGIAYSDILPFWRSPLAAAVHDFSWNKFFGPLPIVSFQNNLYLENNTNTLSYTLLLNDNEFNGSFPEVLFKDCDKLQHFSVNLNSNKISGALMPQFFLNCFQLSNFEASQNRISGLIPPEIASSQMLQLINLSNNTLFGALPDELANLTNLKWISLSGNSLSGPIPASFSNLPDLVILDLSYNNLSGHIPHLRLANDCKNFRGNRFLTPCPVTDSPPPTGIVPDPLPGKHRHGPGKVKSFVIAMAASASIVSFALILMTVLICILGKRKCNRGSSLRRKAMVTFVDASPAELNYDDVTRATGNFSISNLIGTGGFGSTYKAELAPGFTVAVKRLAIGRRFQGGIQQFDAEIRTLGTIRHKNLVTLVGYYVEQSEMLLIYKYLSGGNLESFIHERSGKKMEWAVIHKIAYDIAKALSFLHYSCVPRIVHRDIKPSNILLDEDLNAYLSDFGLARLLEISETHATTDVAGTFGYVAPEYATTCRVSNKADVYSFGIVLLELMSGKKSLDPSFCKYGNGNGGFNIVSWARLLVGEGRFLELFCLELWECGPRDSLVGMLRLALMCTVEVLSVRPSMKQVLEKLKQLSPSPSPSPSPSSSSS